MRKTTVISAVAGLGATVLLAATLLWPRSAVQAQIGLPVGVADCSCTKGTLLEAGPSRVYVHICQCGAQQCVISAGTHAAGNAPPQIAQTCPAAACSTPHVRHIQDTCSPLSRPSRPRSRAGVPTPPMKPQRLVRRNDVRRCSHGLSSGNGRFPTTRGSRP